MSADRNISNDATPHLAEHVRWREDEARDQWVLMAPERVYVPDDIARDVLRRLDGETTFSDVVDQLTARYDAAQETIARDVRTMLSDLIDQGLVAL